MKPNDYGAPGQFCVSCEHFYRSPQRVETKSEWGTCLVARQSVHELEGEYLSCHSAGAKPAAKGDR